MDPDTRTNPHPFSPTQPSKFAPWGALPTKHHRVGGGVTPAVLPHHRTCGSAYGGSCKTLESLRRREQRHQT